MIKRSFFKKTTHAVFALSLLAITPTLFIAKTAYASQSSHEEALFMSLRKLLFPKRSLIRKTWPQWCQEWISILNHLPRYASLKKEIEKVSRWKNPMSIASRMEKALEPYANDIPQDILKRVEELGQVGMIEIIAAILEERPANIPE